MHPYTIFKYLFFILVPFATHSDGSDVATLNTEAIVNKNGAFVKSQFKPGKFADPTTLSNGIVLFLVYPFKLSSKRTNIEPAHAEIELRLYAGDDSKQLAIVEGKIGRPKVFGRPQIP